MWASLSGKLTALLTCSVVSSAMLLPLPAAAQVQSYNFSPVNQYDIGLMAAYWNPIIAWVSQRSGVPLKLRIGRTSADTTGYVLANEVDFVFSNHLFSPEREKLGWRVFGRRNSPAIQGQLLVPQDSPIKDISQLQGQPVAFAGPEAFVVYKVPYAYLLSRNVDVRVVFAGNQNAAFAQLFSGKVAAAGGNSQLVAGYERVDGRKLRVLWSSEPFQDLALMASSRVPEAAMRSVASAFTSMHDDPGGREILAHAADLVGLPRSAYFVPAVGADYAAYKRFYQSAPQSLQ